MIEFNAIKLAIKKTEEKQKVKLASSISARLIQLLPILTKYLPDSILMSPILASDGKELLFIENDISHSFSLQLSIHNEKLEVGENRVNGFHRLYQKRLNEDDFISLFGFRNNQDQKVGNGFVAAKLMSLDGLESKIRSVPHQQHAITVPYSAPNILNFDIQPGFDAVIDYRTRIYRWEGRYDRENVRIYREVWEEK